MAKKELYVLTTSFPYGLGEAFLNTESRFLVQYFNKVHFVPLWKEAGLRQLPDNSIVEAPLLGFNPKGNFRLVMKGLFCLSPFSFAIPLFFREKPWKNKKRFWDFMTSFLLVRAAYSSWPDGMEKDVLVYSYWGDKSALLLPFLKKMTFRKNWPGFLLSLSSVSVFVLLNHRHGNILSLVYSLSSLAVFCAFISRTRIPFFQTAMMISVISLRWLILAQPIQETVMDALLMIPGSLAWILLVFLTCRPFDNKQQEELKCPSHQCGI